MHDKLKPLILKSIREVSNSRLSDERLSQINLFHYGVLDSLMIMHLIIHFEEEFDIEILSPHYDFSTFESVGRIENLIVSLTKKRE